MLVVGTAGGNGGGAYCWDNGEAQGGHGGAGTSYAGGGAGGAGDNAGNYSGRPVGTNANNENGLPGKFNYGWEGKFYPGNFGPFGGGVIVVYGYCVNGSGKWEAKGGVSGGIDARGVWKTMMASGGGSINVFAKNSCELNLSQFNVKVVHSGYSNLVGGIGTVNIRSC